MRPQALDLPPHKIERLHFRVSSLHPVCLDFFGAAPQLIGPYLVKELHQESQGAERGFDVTFIRFGLCFFRFNWSLADYE